MSKRDGEPVLAGSTKDRYDQWHAAMATAEHASSGFNPQPWHKTALNLLPDLNDCDVLEIGCGRGDFAIELSRRYPRVRVRGVDFSEQAIDVARQKLSGVEAAIEFTVGDAEALPYEADSFDWIVSCECLEHVPSPAAMAMEMCRVLRPGGRFVLTTENYFNGMVLGWLNSLVKGIPFDSGSGVQPVEHFFLFFQVRRILRRAGFTIAHMESNHFQWLLLPGVNPAALCTMDVRSPILRRLFLPFGRHFTYLGEKQCEAK